MARPFLQRTKKADRDPPPGRVGLILHAPVFYDLVVWFALSGRTRRFRETTVRLARLEPGESVLDIGCGTGSLAIAAKRHVGPAGQVYGIDPSPQMLARANSKAKRAGAEIFFKQAFAQALPFPDAQFDTVLSSVMLHHLPRKVRQGAIKEVRRVLKPGGRVLAVDFASSDLETRPIFASHRHGHVKLSDIIALLSDAGFNVIDSGPVGFRNLQFALGAVHETP